MHVYGYALPCRFARALAAPIAACTVFAGAALAQTPPAPIDAAPYAVQARIALGAGRRFDYLTLDADARRLYLARADRVEVIDIDTLTRIGSVGGLQGVHGVALVPASSRGYVSDGKADAVVEFDLVTFGRTRTIAVGKNPDALAYDPATQRLVAFNGKSHDASVIDLPGGKVLALSIPMGGKPEFARVAPAGHVYVNIEDTAEIVDLDLNALRVARRYPIAPCTEPTGLALDERQRLYSVCANGLMVESDPHSGKVIGTAPIGAKPDAVLVDAGLAISSNGEGNVTLVRAAPDGTLTASATVPTQKGARTIAVDPRTHRLFLPAPAEGTQDSLEILVLGHAQ